MCRNVKVKSKSNIGDFMVLLSVWSWEIFEIGRPVPDHRDHHGNLELYGYMDAEMVQS